MSAAIPAERPCALATPQSLLDRRQRIASAPEAPPLPGVETTEVRIGGVRCLSSSAQRRPDDGPQPTTVYFHGGGYRLGSPELFRAFAEQLALASGERVIAVDYRLAPEHPYPAALHDAIHVYRALAGSSPTPPALVGDSAGGGLAAALAAAGAALGLPRPRALVLLSGWVDLRCTAESYRTRADTDPLFGHADARTAAAQYLQGWPDDDPLASPVLGDLRGFPPALLLASSSECLLDDTLAMSAGLARAGVPVRAEVFADLPHAWPTVDPARAESARAVRIVADALARTTTG
ncbi:alpha/beta hydrolase [Microbacterium resistens]|uniref:alpha/beta hydrolase n=1 Tax=Microbacterium resistens TaxID=156977 RepID=UPI000836FD9E|nr:alpha/beta hydrolase [Microbacterium resistens]